MNWFEKILNGLNKALEEVIQGVKKGIDTFIEEINDKEHVPNYISVLIYDEELGDYINHIFDANLDLEQIKRNHYRRNEKIEY